MHEGGDEEHSLEGICGERFPCCGVDGGHAVCALELRFDGIRCCCMAGSSY